MCLYVICCCCSVTQSRLTLPPYGLQHARPPCHSLSFGVCTSSCSLRWWCHPAISSSDAFFCSQSFPASATFSLNHLFASDDQNTGAAASASVLPGNIQGWSPFRLTGLVPLLPKGLSWVFSSTTVWRNQLFGGLPSSWSSSHNHTWLLRKP